MVTLDFSTVASSVTIMASRTSLRTASISIGAKNRRRLSAARAGRKIVITYLTQFLTDLHMIVTIAAGLIMAYMIMEVLDKINNGDDNGPDSFV